MEKCENQIVLFESSDKVVTLDVTIDKETVWLTQLQMAILFDVERSVISKHISNIFKEKEADEKSNVHFLHIANSDKPVKSLKDLGKKWFAFSRMEINTESLLGKM